MKTHLHTKVTEGQEGELRNAGLLFLWGCGRCNTANTALSQAGRLYPPAGEQGCLCWCYSSGRRRMKPKSRSWGLHLQAWRHIYCRSTKQSFTSLLHLLGVIPPDWGIMEFIIVVPGHLSWSQGCSCIVSLLIVITAPPGVKWGLLFLGSFTTETSLSPEDFNTTAFFHEESDTELCG